MYLEIMELQKVADMCETFIMHDHVPAMYLVEPVTHIVSRRLDRWLTYFASLSSETLAWRERVLNGHITLQEGP